MESALIKVLAACLISFWFGGFMIWRGAKGHVWRSRFTGDAIIPAWIYIATGVAIIGATLAYIFVAYLLARA